MGAIKSSTLGAIMLRILLALIHLVSFTRYMHAHHVPHAEHVERSDEIVKCSRDDFKDFEDVSGTPCCPPPVLFTAQRAKLSCIFNGQNYL